MFKIESYITPLLMGYVDKYVKLRPEDFQLSLWGGDAVLNNLDLRLDMIERAIQLPITFKSGYVHELRIHVPWTKLGSEPVVITINTIECILKLRDKAYEDSRKLRSKDLRKSRSSNQIKAKRTGDEDLPPGYLQSLMNKIINNVSIIVNNLIVKFVEDDIVLSLNAKSAECYSVDKTWNRAFVDLSAPDFILRKSVNFCDLTVCLDKCDASGRIETYQDPLIYRCSVTGRVYTKYDSVTSKLPSITKLDLFCDKLDVSLTDTQLPMFSRLIELCIALYYGTKEYSNGPETVPSESDTQEQEGPLEEEASVSNESGGDDQGWAAWAWSYVPQILPSETEEGAEGETTPKKRSPPILSIGMYAHKASITFKLTEVLKEKHQFGPKKIAFQPFMLLEGEGITMEILLGGLAFFDMKVGFTNCQLLSQGNCICGARDEGDTRIQVMLQGGSPLQSKSLLNYYSRSLFDLACPANQDAELQFVLDTEEHLRIHSEQYVTERFGVFFLDYLYTMPDANNQTKQESSRSSVTSDTEEVVFVNENSLIRYIVGPLHVNVSSSAVHRIQKFISCAKDHTYEPYAKSKPEVVNDSYPHPTEEQVRSLEKFIPTNTHHVTLLKPTATIFYAEHPSCDVKKKNYHTIKRLQKTKEDPSKQSVNNLPCVAIVTNRFDYQISYAMYPRKLVRIISKTVGPSQNLLHHCYSHTQMKLFGFSAGIIQVEKTGAKSHQVTVIPPCSGALYMKQLLLPMYWKNAHLPKGEQLYQLPQLSVNLNKANLLLGVQIWSSWQQNSPKPCVLMDSSLMDDIFQTDGPSETENSIPVLAMSLSGLELKKCRTSSATAYSGTLSSIQVIMYDVNQTKPRPLLYAPANTSRLHKTEFFLGPAPLHEDTDEDFLMFTYQLPNKQETTDVPSALLVSMEGVVCLLDPALINWFSYDPHNNVKLSNQGRETVTLDASLVKATLPLKTNTSQVSLASSGSVTPNTESLRQTQTNTDTPTVTHTRSTAHVPTTQGEEGQKVKEGTDGGDDLSNKLATLFPFIRMLQVQVDIKSCCVFVNKTSMTVPEPSVYIPQNFLSALQQGVVPGTVVICLPHLHVVSSGVKQVHPLQEIPITSMDGSLVGEKLPWIMSLKNFSIYTLLSRTAVFSILKPVSVNCTVAVSTKYSPPTSDVISALGLCLHTDMRSVTLACSKQQVQLCTSTGIWLNTLLKRGFALTKSLLRPEKVKVTLTPRSDMKETRNPPSLQRDQPNMAAITEDVEQTETGTSGELTSRDTTPIRDLLMKDMPENGVKLSLWLQWTLPKFEIRFYRQREGQGQDTKVTVVMEDLTTSVDVEAIYAKVKVTCGGCCIHHYNRNHQSAKPTSWSKGENLGILMSSQKELASDIHVVSNKVWSCDSQTSPTHTFMIGESKTREVNRRFINLTFTRALCKNVKQKLRKINADLVGVQEVGSEVANELYFHKHISEVCLSLEPCDFVFNIPALLTVADCFAVSSVKNSGSLPKSSTPNLVAGEPNFAPMVTSSLLPLLYVDMASIRVFMPVKHSTGPDLASRVEKDNKFTSTVDHDLIVGFIHSIAVTPQADNPLPRYAVEKELYSRAMHHGIDRVPGSSIENRQYQMEFKGLSLCTGCWSDFVDRQTSGEQSDIATPTIQIPALEWNTLLKPEKQKMDIQLVPLVASLDMKIVAAPAITYTPKEDSQIPILVCGHTIELNASSDIDFFISTNQVHLLECWISQSKVVLLPPKIQKPDDEMDKVDEIKSDHMTYDSGIGSESSALILLKGVSPIPLHHMATLEHVQSPKFVNPFDLLLTAGRISCTVYTHKLLKEDYHANKTQDCRDDADSPGNKSSPQEGSESERNRSSYSFLNIHDVYRDTEKVIRSGSCVIQPFLYVYFSQPHTVLKCHHVEQTFEMSCYDILIKGAASNLIEADDKKIIPDCSDFQLYWIETRAGKPHPKTGIPPSLYTLRVNNFLKDTAACINLKVERPLKVNLSEEKLDQVQQFIEDLLLSNRKQEQEAEVKDQVASWKSQVQGHQPDLFHVVLGKLERLELQTEQIVVSMETGTDFKNSGIIGCVDGTRLEMGLDQVSTGSIESVEAYLLLKDIKVLSVYEKQSQTLLHPCTVTVDAVMEWYKNSDWQSHISTMSATITTGLVTVTLGQEHFMCFTSLQEQLKRMLKKNRKAKGKFPYKESSTSKTKETKMEKDEDLILEQTTDDLRSGQFQYVQNPDPDVEAGSGEITFCSRDSAGNSLMTWCYDEPRVISHVSFTPIPFNVPREVRAMGESGTLIPCTLQYQDTATQHYLPYVDFELSEDTQTILQLPEVKVINTSDLVVAQTWRVLIHNTMLTHNSSSDEEATPVSDLAILPESLAASMCVDSCYVPSLIPSVQVYLSVPAVEVHLQNHLTYLGKEVPEKLQPFMFDRSCVEDQEFAVLSARQMTVTASVLNGPHASTCIQMNGSPELEVIEYKTLTRQRVVRPFEMYADITYTPGTVSPLVESNVTVDPMMLSVGRGTVHTLSSASQAWSQILSNKGDNSHIVYSHYVICNDTHHTIRFGQVGTEENQVLMSRKMHCYSWRTHKSKQQLHVCLDGKVWKWCEPFDIESDCKIVRTVRTNDQIYSLIIYIQQLTNVQKQIKVRGQLMLFSCLTLPFEVKVNTTTSNDGYDLELHHNQQLPTFVLEPEEVRSIKLRPLGSHGNWSHDIYITGDRMKENRTVKIQQLDSSHFHIWCRVLCSHFKSTINTKVLLSPLYVLRSHLPRPVFVKLDTPKLKTQQQLEIPGQGRELQLYCSGSDVSHSLNFKLKNDEDETSSQALALTTGLISQVERAVVEKQDTDKLCRLWTVNHPKDWPYCFQNNDSYDNECEAVYTAPSGDNCMESLDISDVDAADLTMTLNINLSEYWPGSNTLLVNLSPWCLMTNQSDLDLMVMDTTGSQWTLPSGKTYSPPRFEGEIMLGLRIGSGVVCTGSIPLSDEEVDLQRYRPDIGQVLYLDGYVHTRISVTQANTVKVYFLTVQSSVRHRMRVITILESMCITNLTGQPYQALLQCVCPRTGQVQRMATSMGVCIPDHAKVSKQETDLFPLLQWSHDQSHDTVQLQEEDSWIHYIILQSIKTEACHTYSDWSNPVRLLANRNAVRTTVSVPNKRSGLFTEPVCITGQERNGVAYFVMWKDKSPSCLLQNSTNLPVYYGHHNANITSPNITVQEETELVGGPPFIPVRQNVFYTPSLINGVFEDDISNTRLPSLHFAVNSKDLHIQEKSNESKSENQTEGQSASEKCLSWSRAIDVNSDMEMFVPIPGCIDVKVKVWKVAMVTSITIEPISKAEVSAKEIRSRLTGQQRTVTTVAEELPPDNSFSESSHPVHSLQDLHLLRPAVASIDLTVGVRLRHLTISLKDETSSSEEVSEVLRVSMDELFLAYFPSGQVSFDESASHSCISACVGVIQLDNQLFHTKGLHDFPVLFLPQNIPDPSQLALPNLQNLSISEKFAVLKSVSFLHAQVVVGTDILNNSVTKRMELGIQAATANIADGFVLRLLKEVEGLIPTKLSNSSQKNKSILVKKLPKSLRCVSMAFSSPVKIEHLCIQPISLLFSLHASLKLFIASDRTPLSFGKFERKDVCGVSHQVVRVLAMHYATGALFRVGIVVGSLEILGNPTGLVRSIGTGVADLVKMPYTGLTQGPGAFVAGVSNGMTSFVKNISSGMIMSVTSFASSVSRNMDRLSLDQTHQQRQEERRRNQPHGISSGLKQGLTGLGMSLLGAVAGIADQPIQNIISNQEADERPKSTSAAATGVMTGVGKGLVGAFTKPIGGAAELVSQTGQGILLGTGLAGDSPKVRYTAVTHAVSSFFSCRLKYLGKLLQAMSPNDLLTSVSAAFLDVTGSEVRVELLVTNELLVVMDCEEDCQQQAFSLAELEVSLKPGNPHLLTLLWKDRSHQATGEYENENKDRVEAFIDGAADYVHVSPPRSPIGAPKSLIALRSSLKLQSFYRCLSSMASKHVKTSIHHDEITKSPQDRRQYRGLELNNGLKVMVISDPDTDKSAAAMDINIGSMSDPWELPGLAHFCEHMLFLGTKKYEQENEYNKFLNENGGSSNAYTSGEHTNFYFDVAPDNLAGAMDRFAQFFLGPLFTASATEREINAVNSENDKNLQSDPWRLHQLDRSLAKPDHDYVKFGTGNKDSLDTLPKSRGQDVREELLKFHSKFYSSNIMALCILGKESLDELSDLVAPLLADVINKNTSVPEWSEHPYGPEQCKLICYALPVKDVRNLSMSWSIPDLHPYYTSNPGHYLGHLVGHEGPGSLLSELKAKGWVNTLCGGQSNGAKGFMFFKVDVDLTEEGIEHVDDIVTLTYQYINLLRKAGAQEWIFKECQDLSAMTFRFKDKEKPRNYASGLSGSLHDYPMTEALSGPYLLTEFRPDLINMILEKITPDNMRIGVIGKKFQDRVNEKEKWYGTEYMVEAIPEVKLQQWTSCGVNDKLKLPARNEFVPTIFDLAPREVDPSPLPEMAKDSALTRLWFKQDDTFLLPKACINFEISSPLAYSDPTKCNMTNLFVTLFKDALNEYAYDAELAGLHYDLNCTIYGMSLAVGGYNEKQDVLLRKIMEKLTTFKVDPKRFAIFKEMYARSMRNFQAEQPHRHAIYYTNILMSEVKWTNEELMHALEDITDEKVQAFIPELLSKLYLEGLIYGNFTKQKALEVTEMIEDILKKQSGTRSLLPSQKKHFRELQLPDGCYYMCEETNQVHKSSSIEIYYQCGVQQTDANMLLELFIQIIGEPCFDILRTKEQLGYIVFSGIRRTSGVQGMRIIVQSDRTPQYVENRVEAFLQSMEAYIKDMTDESFQKHVTALAAKRLEKPKKISGQQSRYWGEIVSQQFNFDRDDVEVVFLRGLKKNDVYNFYKDHICLGAPRRHKLSVHVLSTAEGTGTPDSQNSDNSPNSLTSTPELPQPIIVRNISDFKRDMALFPLPKPYIDLQKAMSKL